MSTQAPTDPLKLEKGDIVRFDSQPWEVKGFRSLGMAATARVALEHLKTGDVEVFSAQDVREKGRLVVAAADRVPPAIPDLPVSTECLVAEARAVRLGLAA